MHSQGHQGLCCGLVQFCLRYCAAPLASVDARLAKDALAAARDAPPPASQGVWAGFTGIAPELRKFWLASPLSTCCFLGSMKVATLFHGPAALLHSSTRNRY